MKLRKNSSLPFINVYSELLGIIESGILLHADKEILFARLKRLVDMCVV